MVSVKQGKTLQKKKRSQKKQLPYFIATEAQGRPFQKGFEEGYLRGRAHYIMNQVAEPFPKRPVQVLYVSSGKGFPYSQLDEAIQGTLKDMVMTVHVAEPGEKIAELASTIKPDLLLVLNGLSLPTEQVEAIRKEGTRTAIWLTDDPHYVDLTLKIVPHYDFVFTHEPNCIELYQKQGCTSVHDLPFAAYLPQFHPNTFPAHHEREISCIGSGSWDRIHFFSSILPQMMSYQTIFNGRGWDRFDDYRKYKHQIELNRWMNPSENKEIYNSTKIVLNLPRSHEAHEDNHNSLQIPAYSPNRRTFEISACATLQFTDAREDLSRFYTPGIEIETFTSASELMDKIEYYLTHEDKRRDIALRGFERTWKEHSYHHRIHTLLETVF